MFEAYAEWNVFLKPRFPGTVQHGMHVTSDCRCLLDVQISTQTLRQRAAQLSPCWNVGYDQRWDQS